MNVYMPLIVGILLIAMGVLLFFIAVLSKNPNHDRKKLYKVVLFMVALGVSMFFVHHSDTKKKAEARASAALKEQNIAEPVTRPSFAEFASAYNEIFGGLEEMEITDWDRTTGDRFDTAKFVGSNYVLGVNMDKEFPRFVSDVLFVFQNADTLEAWSNYLRMLALIRILEPDMPEEEASRFLSRVMEDEEGVPSDSGTFYSYGVGIFTADLPR
ncbi:MAG: tripartite tricarboxylate transporter TctB family protein [Treponema sp.]|nr:tripartite tricarboxylate transporter TctB family protein [Treponema sp.]